MVEGHSIALSISAALIGPSRKTRGCGPVQSTTVEGTPPGAGPPSMIRSINFIIKDLPIHLD